MSERSITVPINVNTKQSSPSNSLITLLSINNSKETADTAFLNQSFKNLSNGDRSLDLITKPLNPAHTRGGSRESIKMVGIPDEHKYNMQTEPLLNSKKIDVNNSDNHINNGNNSGNAINHNERLFLYDEDSSIDSQQSRISLFEEEEDEGDEDNTDFRSDVSFLDTDYPTLEITRMISVNAFWLGYQLFWFVVFVILVPYHVEIIVGEENKGKGLSIVSICSGILNLFLAVITGKLNDEVTTKYGKRKPWILFGSVFMVITFLFMNENRSIATYSILYTLFTGSTVICSVPFNGFVADVSVNSNKGRMSSIMGGMNLLGYLIGTSLGVLVKPFGFGVINAIIIVIFSIGVIITLFSTAEIPSNFIKRQKINKDSIPFRIRATNYCYNLVAPLYENPDFRYIFLSRFFYQLTISSIQQFMQYWLGDCTNSGSKFNLAPSIAVSYAFLPLMITSPIAAFLCPTTHRKRTVAFSSLMIGLVLICLTVCYSFIFAIVISFLFGIAYGPFMSTEFAMLMDVIPEENAARDVALWHSALVLPQILGTPIEGLLLDSLKGVGEKYGAKCFRYDVIWGICSVFVAIGWILTTKINGIK